MKTPSRRGGQSQADIVDPRENPGSYTQLDDGTFVSNGPAFVAAAGTSEAAPAPVLPPESAVAIANALAAIGQDIPAVVEASLPPIDPEPESAPEPTPETPTAPAVEA